MTPAPRLTDTASRPILRLFSPDNPPAESGPPPLSPALTLGQFFDLYYLPEILLARRNASRSTITLYRDALRWWSLLTDNPPLAEITDATTARFLAGLRSATWKRGRLGTPRLLSTATQRKLICQIAWILHRAGPTLSPKRRGQGLLAELPELDAPPLHATPKPCFSLEECRRLFAAGSAAPPAERWPARLVLLFATGLRLWTACALTPEHLSHEADGWWLDVPAALNCKTRKGCRIALRAEAAELLAAQPAGRPLADWPHCRRFLSTAHARLQRAALPERTAPLSPQAWRRTHGRQMALLGADHAQAIAQAALQHADARTTREHYVDVLHELRRQLPLLWE